VILVLAGYYPPAFLAGGPTRSLPRIVDALRDEFDFRIVTRDRDLGSSAPLPGVVSDRWIEAGGVRCIYLSTRGRLAGALSGVLRRTRHDVLYLNSLFSVPFSLIPQLLRRFGLVSRRGLVMAPRGELDPSALALKAVRKRLYLSLVRSLGLLDDAVWHAATESEAAAIRRAFGQSARALVARDISQQPGPAPSHPPKQPGSLDLVFLSRISPMKNLDFAIAALRDVHGRVRFSIYGPIEDPEYWAACRRQAERLPGNVTVEYRGVVNPSDVGGVLAAHHVFFLPTRAESFGHAISESLLAGCPVLISDQTPWRDLEARHAGWDLPLGEPERFTAAIERCVAMSSAELEVWSAGAHELGREIAKDPTLDAAYRTIFRTAAARSG
jgi:glycosyltransferase involved in cell wall biosynthesis